MPAFQPQRFGEYILTAHLGRGGMADVYRAQRTGVAGFERTAVVKRILQPYNDDPNFVAMFINEAKIAAQLTHPNIAHVYELGEVDGEFFMAMEYVKGKDLLHVLRILAKSNPDRRHLPPEVAAYVAREICRGLAHAHDHTDDEGKPRPIVHRDVSPQNIMISYDGQVKLVDFGIAKAMFVVREETRSGTLKGKIAYMSPEQVNGTSPGPESDVFSAGVVMYEMLIGRRLFKGQNDYDTLTRVKSMAIPPPSRVASWVPAELDRVVMHALERERSGRYKRAASMARDLDEFLQTARFSVEHMAEWMASTFPPEAREEVPDGHAARTPDPSSASRSRSALPSAARGATNPGTPSALDRASSRSGAGRSTGGRRALVIACALAVVVGLGGALIAVGPLSRRRAASGVVTPAAAPVAVEAPDLGGVHVGLAEPVVPPPAVSSAGEPIHSPAGAHHSSSTRAHPSTPTGKARPKIEVFEDGEPPKPKIETFDD